MKRKFEVGDRVSFNWAGRKGTVKIVETETGSGGGLILVKLEGALKGKGHDGNSHSKGNMKQMIIIISNQQV